MVTPMSNPDEYARQHALVAALVNDRPFPHAVKTVRVVETHISWVLLAGRYAYKIKKAVDLGFLNFIGLDARRRYCEEEIRLNRRLAPSIYLDVIAIGGEPGRPEIGGQPVIEYAVRMRRFEETRQLDRLLARGKLDAEVIDRLTATLAAFHRRIPCARPEDDFGTPATIAAAAMQNFDQLQSLLSAGSDRETAAALRTTTQSESAACNPLFELRRNQGFVRECHGDLHLGNIVLLAEQPVPFDGVEFDPALRWIDVISEVAFLVMDMLYHRRPDLAYRFLNGWLEATGDHAGLAVMRFYLAYRAVVRAKVNAIRTVQLDPEDRPALAACRGYLALAKECFAARRALLVTHGLPGSGKSTFALVATGRLQAIRIRSDVERKRMFGMQPLDQSRPGEAAVIYGADATRRTYERLLELARTVLDAGFPVIVDAAFILQEEREKFRLLALDLQVPFAIVSMQASDAVLHARIRRRQALADDASEADVDVLERLQVSVQPLTQQELACSVKMLNDRDGSIADAEAWGKLDNLVTGRNA